VIRDWVETDPAYWALTWVDDERFGPTDIVRMLEKASRQPQTPDFLALWIGDRLTEREAGTAALEAYEKAAVSSDPEVLYRLGERLRERGELERSLEAFERASEIDAGRVDSPPEHHPDEYRRAIGEALWKLGHHDEAVAKFSAIAEQPVALGDRWRTSLVWSLSTGGSVRTADSYRLLKDWLGRELTVAQRSEWAARGAGDDSAVSRFQERRRDAAEAILLLTRDRYQQLVRRPLDGSFSALSEGMTPTVLPIALQAHQSFFPNADATPEVARMVDEEIPALQARVKSATGVTIPPVYILSVQDLRPGEYKLLIDEVALGGGLLGGERSFAPDGGTCRALGIGGRDDATSLPGMAGVWLPHDERADSARAAGLEVWDAYTFMLRHLETLLLRNLEAFLGVEEVGDLLRGWAEPLAIVEAPQDLLPDGGETAEVARLRSTELPNVRTRVWDETGVLVREPEFRVGERLETGEYRLLLDDVAVDAGRLGEEPFFCPDGEACRRRQLEGRSAPAPLDGAEGMWLNEDDEARRQELEVWDRHTYMLRHMEAVLARRLRERRRLHSHALPDERSLVRLAAVLQGLVTEGVPISDVDTILAEFANAPRSAEIYAVVERVRSVLRAELPGTVGSDRLVGLEPGFEDEVARWTQTRDGRHFLALPPQRAQVLRQLLEQQIAGVDETHCALVVRRRDLRPFVRRLTELGHPTLPVVAVGELPEDRFPPELLRGRGPSGGG
jgi:type III secretory pathway component EscV